MFFFCETLKRICEEQGILQLFLTLNLKENDLPITNGTG